MKTFLFTIMAEEELSSKSDDEETTFESMAEEGEAMVEAESESEIFSHPLGQYVIVIVGESVQEGNTVISPTIRLEEITEDDVPEDEGSLDETLESVTSSDSSGIITEEWPMEESEGLADTESVDTTTTWMSESPKIPEGLEEQE